MSRRGGRQRWWKRAARLAAIAALLISGPAAAQGASLLIPADPGVSASLYAEGPIPRPYRFRVDRSRPSTLALLGEVRGLRKGVGMDYRLSDVINLHLNLYSGRDGFGRGRRWSLGGVNAGDAPSSRLWSLGASADLVRFRRDTEEQRPDARVVLSPQLMLDVDALTGLPGNCDLMIQQTLWRGADERATADQRVTQFILKWKF